MLVCCSYLALSDGEHDVKLISPEYDPFAESRTFVIKSEGSTVPGATEDTRSQEPSVASHLGKCIQQWSWVLPGRHRHEVTAVQATGQRDTSKGRDSW